MVKNTPSNIPICSTTCEFLLEYGINMSELSTCRAMPAVNYFEWSIYKCKDQF